MWAGGAINSTGDLIIGEAVAQTSKISDIALITGQPGVLCFITVLHMATCNGRDVQKECQDIVYRDDTSSSAPDSGSKQNPAPTLKPAATSKKNAVIIPSAPYLFRFLAVTFNGHRIHYDEPYATNVEGYPGLMVRGPFQATLLCQYAPDLKGAAPKSFDFRSISSLFNNNNFLINSASEDDGLKLWTAREGGSVAGPVSMQAKAKW